VQDHVAARIVPRGATVTAIRPAEAPDFDITLYLTADGMMPRHHVVQPALDGGHRPQFVLAVREPLSNPHYRLFRELPEGRIYEAIP
jgi:hypothetical protein